MSYPDYGPGYYGPPPQSHPNGTTILVLGILSIVVCSFIGPFAWVMGNKAIKEIDSSGYYYENRGQIQAGRICGIIGTVFLILAALFVAFIITMSVIASINTY